MLNATTTVVLVAHRRDSCARTDRKDQVRKPNAHICAPLAITQFMPVGELSVPGEKMSRESERAMYSIKQLNVIRAAEIAEVAPHVPARARVLEIGAGTGQQALELQRCGFEVNAIELADSAYASARVFPVIDYDGAHIPFPTGTFDVAFSSNALEHVHDLTGLHAEIHRVLKPGGIVIHVLPTHAWRFWSTLSSLVSAPIYVGAALRRMLPGSHDSRTVGRAWFEAIRACGAAVLQPRHGERGFGLAELWLFHPRWWRKHFEHNGFALLYDQPMRLFYTGSMVFGAWLSLERRAWLAQILGSSCHLYVMHPAAEIVQCIANDSRRQQKSKSRSPGQPA